MTVTLIQITTTVMGITVMVITTALACRFWRLNKPISKAFSYNLIGEFIAASMTTFFNTVHIMGYLPKVPISVATVLRITTFAVMLASSIHMAILISRLEQRENQ